MLIRKWNPVLSDNYWYLASPLKYFTNRNSMVPVVARITGRPDPIPVRRMCADSTEDSVHCCAVCKTGHTGCKVDPVAVSDLSSVASTVASGARIRAHAHRAALHRIYIKNAFCILDCGQYRQVLTATFCSFRYGRAHAITASPATRTALRSRRTGDASRPSIARRMASGDSSRAWHTSTQRSGSPAVPGAPSIHASALDRSLRSRRDFAVRRAEYR